MSACHTIYVAATQYVRAYSRLRRGSLVYCAQDGVAPEVLIFPLLRAGGGGGDGAAGGTVVSKVFFDITIDGKPVGKGLPTGLHHQS